MSEIDTLLYDVTQRLGKVTAYKYAVLGGYTGTEEEFMRALALYPSLADGTVEAKEQAMAARDEAVNAISIIANYIAVGEKAANDAGTYAGQADESARQASADAGVASVSAVRAVASADQAAELLNLISRHYPGVVTRADVLNLFGYEEIRVSMKDMSGNDVVVTMIGIASSGVDNNAYVGTAFVGNATLLS